MTQPNLENETYNDIEQEKRAQARQASAYAAGETDQLPSFALKGPDARLRDGEFEVEVTPEEPKVTPKPKSKPKPKPEPEPEPDDTTKASA